MDIPFGNIVEKECPAFLQQTHCLVDPSKAPRQVVGTVEVVVDTSTVVLIEVEWWVGEDAVHAAIWQLLHDLNAVTLIEVAKRRREYGLQLLCVRRGQRLPCPGGEPVTERILRRVLASLCWEDQRAAWVELRPE